MAVPSKAKVCGRSIAGVAGSNPAERMGFRLFCVVKIAVFRLVQNIPTGCVCVCLSYCVWSRGLHNEVA
jgi:hypothetical protein